MVAVAFFLVKKCPEVLEVSSTQSHFFCKITETTALILKSYSLIMQEGMFLSG